ncbi:MAG TPA: CpsD/CapB family tyrosine-protein kinase, partial [Blastocatellia bacterium]|nr:CpsD/CapB family tyrosine-protein kinase [Blastocatellia bacterium]
EGKTTTVVNMASSLAQLDRSVLVIDCDLRKPTVHKLFGASEDPGLATYLLSDARLESLIRRLPMKRLHLLPAGTCTANPAELLSSEKMKNLLRLLSARYDHILIDAPPLVNLAEPLLLSTMADGVILVVNSGKSERDAVLRARDELLNVGAEIFGVVLNNVDFRREGLGDYYKDYYGKS